LGGFDSTVASTEQAADRTGQFTHLGLILL
jgi:hypothetical protein